MHTRSQTHTSRQLPMLFFIAWRNIWRNPIRSVLTISALASGLIMVVFYSAMMEGMLRQMVYQATAISTGHIQIHRQAYIDDQDMYATFPWPWLDAIERDVPGINVAPRLYASGLASTTESSTGVMLKAVDPKREPTVTKMLTQVRSGTLNLGLASDSAEGLPRFYVVVGAQLAKNMHLIPGSELILVTQAADGSVGNGLFVVSAILKPLSPNFDRMGVLMSILAYQQLMVLDGGFHELAIHVEDAEHMQAAEALLVHNIDKRNQAQPLDDLGGKAVLRNWRTLSPMISDMLEMSKTINFIVGFIVICLASMGMLNTMLMAVHERSHEFGILIAIGMKRRWLLLMVMLESLLLALVSALVGVIIGISGISAFGERGIDLSGTMPDGYDWGGLVFEPYMQLYIDSINILSACVLMVVITLLAAVIPAWRTVRLDPAEVMR